MAAQRWDMTQMPRHFVAPSTSVPQLMPHIAVNTSEIAVCCLASLQKTFKQIKDAPNAIPRCTGIIFNKKFFPQVYASEKY